jgi:predicted NAD/FAD-binding protein
VRLAIVGAGISGLVVAHLLQDRHEITVFEAADYAGGHTHTVRVDFSDEVQQVDTGFIVFNDRNYPNFERLLRRLDVAWQPSDMSFSVSDESGAFEYGSTSPNAVFARRSHLVDPTFMRMLVDLRRFQGAARALVAAGGSDDRSLGQWLEDGRYSRRFIEQLIVPQVAAVWSADPRALWSFPIAFMAEFFANHGMLGLRNRPAWRTVTGGSARYVDALTAHMNGRLRLSRPVREVVRGTDHVLVTAAGAEPERFDQVVFATHSDQALHLLSDATSAEREILGAIPYQRNEAVLHTDERMLPRRRRAWASWNYHLLADAGPHATVTYHMNRLQSLRSRRQFCVTLNRTAAIDPARIIRTIDYAHPVYTPKGVAAQARVAEISGHRGTHFCGAYWGWGFHEDGVRSALRVATALGGQW